MRKEQTEPRWWKSNYNFSEKIEFLRYRIAHPKEQIYTILDHRLAPGVHTVTSGAPDYSILFIGDFMPIDGLALSIDSELSQLLRSADLLVINLEGVVTNLQRFLALSHQVNVLDKIRALSEKRIVLNLANNHASDFGVDGFYRQIKVLEDYGFPLFGFDGHSFVAKEKIALHASTLWSNQDIKSAHRFKLTEPLSAPDAGLYNIYMPHWGYEMELNPRSDQVDYAHAALSNGWDAIIGSHPHVPQPLELVEDKPVLYSLGNFCYNDVNPNHWYGSLLKLSFDTLSEAKPRLLQIEHHYTLQAPEKERVNVSLTDRLDYRSLRKRMSRIWSYFSDLLK